MLPFIVSLIPLTKSFYIYNRLSIKIGREEYNEERSFTHSFTTSIWRNNSNNILLLKDIQTLLSEWSVYSLYCNLDPCINSNFLKVVLLIIYINYKKVYLKALYPLLLHLSNNKKYQILFKNIKDLESRFRP
jgi:hypothetical protein